MAEGKRGLVTTLLGPREAAVARVSPRSRAAQRPRGDSGRSPRRVRGERQGARVCRCGLHRSAGTPGSPRFLSLFAFPARIRIAAATRATSAAVCTPPPLPRPCALDAASQGWSVGHLDQGRWGRAAVFVFFLPPSPLPALGGVLLSGAILMAIRRRAAGGGRGVLAAAGGRAFGRVRWRVRWRVRTCVRWWWWCSCLFRRVW